RNLLFAGPSGSGKTDLARGFLERLAERAYQFCVVDPEGDYGTLDPAVSIGDSKRAPSVDEVLQLLADPGHNAVVNLLGLQLERRPAFFESLLPRLQELRARLGRPHLVMVDEAHHLMPAGWDPTVLALPRQLEGMLLISAHADHLAGTVRGIVDATVWFGREPGGGELPAGEAVLSATDGGEPPVRFKVAASQAQHRRHLRKYAEGELGDDRSFWFRGPEGALRLRAQNLT